MEAILCNDIRRLIELIFLHDFAGVLRDGSCFFPDAVFAVSCKAHEYESGISAERIDDVDEFLEISCSENETENCETERNEYEFKSTILCNLSYIAP